ncbi:MAG: glycosyltransferase [Candidatus Micrarchaeales archaeon]|uniref:Glycosyl transferase family 2 n=1 Tax=Candidatus Micrarchaeum acidiphilum ARMAN-2 TaxID=425595 RepID=C7DHF2_MICA2|nr:MAG: glycosyl transferase family 2 [Candidatus Micrarchaeum acidiphilum ARMAN-2]MCW6160622.1 glycosyltransferase [Candidatus Micrarchaeales archaeon]
MFFQFTTFRIEALIVYSSIIFGLLTAVYYAVNMRRSLQYSPKRKRPAPGSKSDVTIVIPVYNENPDIFRNCVASAARQGTKLIVVGDSGPEPYRAITEENGGTFIHRKVRDGKRSALTTGVNSLDTKYVMFLDSDTVLPDNAVESMLSMFDERTGGVGAGVSVRLRNDWVSYSSEFFEKLKEVMTRALSASGAVMVLDGRCAMYRVSAIKEFMNSEEYLHNSILGVRSILAEDRHITSHVAKLGYRLVVDYNVFVKTEAQKSFVLLWKQMTRWTRAGYMYFAKEIMDGTYRKRGAFYAFEMFYMYLLPIIIIAFTAVRLYFYLGHGFGADFTREIYVLGRVFRLGMGAFDSRFVVYIGVQVLDFLAILGFGLAIYVRVGAKKLRTFMLGGVALLVMMFASFYGLMTVWKQKDWLTR